MAKDGGWCILLIGKVKKPTNPLRSRDKQVRTSPDETVSPYNHINHLFSSLFHLDSQVHRMSNPRPQAPLAHTRCHETPPMPLARIGLDVAWWHLHAHLDFCVLLRSCRKSLGIVYKLNKVELYWRFVRPNLRTCARIASEAETVTAHWWICLIQKCTLPNHAKFLVTCSDVQYMKWMTNFFFPCNHSHACDLPLSWGMEPPNSWAVSPRSSCAFFFDFWGVIVPLVFSLLLGVENAYMSQPFGTCLWVGPSFLVCAAVYILHNVLMCRRGTSWTPKRPKTYSATLPLSISNPSCCILKDHPTHRPPCKLVGKEGSATVLTAFQNYIKLRYHKIGPQNWAMKNSSPLLWVLVCSRDCCHNATSIQFFFISLDSYHTLIHYCNIPLWIPWPTQTRQSIVQNGRTSKNLYRIMIMATFFLSIKSRAMVQHKPKPHYRINNP